jgi:hypothetical protein
MRDCGPAGAWRWAEVEEAPLLDSRTTGGGDEPAAATTRSALLCGWSLEVSSLKRRVLPRYLSWATQ